MLKAQTLLENISEDLQRIELKENLKASVESLAESVTAKFSDGCQSSPNPHRMTDALDELDEIRQTLHDELDVLNDRVRIVRNLVNSLHGKNEIAVLNKRYLEDKNWKTICKELHVSKSQIFRVHRSALDQVQELLDAAALRKGEDL